MQKFSVLLVVVSLGLLAGCQTGRVGGNTNSSRQPIGPPQTIAEESRAVQGGSFGNQ